MSRTFIRLGKLIRKRNSMLVTMSVILLIVTMTAGIFFIGRLLGQVTKKEHNIEAITIGLSNGKVIQKQYLTPNQYSRPQIRLKKVKGIVVHYTANPGTSADNNRSYFEGLATKKTTYASSHYIIGLDGEIVQCIPLTEEAYASNDRNADTISIECCHPDKTGKFTDATYASLVSLTSALCETFHLKENDIIRHYDVTGKLCPLYFVEHEDAWLAFKDDVMVDLKQIKDEKKLMS